MKTLLNIVKKANSIPNLNKGGCGVFAFLVHKKTNKGTLTGFFNEKETPKHVTIQIGEKHFDSDGFQSEDSIVSAVKGHPFESIKKRSLTPKELKSLLKKDGWADEFDRKDIKTIKKILK